MRNLPRAHPAYCIAFLRRFTVTCRPIFAFSSLNAVYFSWLRSLESHENTLLQDFWGSASLHTLTPLQPEDFFQDVSSEERNKIVSKSIQSFIICGRFVVSLTDVGENVSDCHGSMLLWKFDTQLHSITLIVRESSNFDR